MNDHRRAFTLIELLVVIAIIAVLAGMLMAGLMLLKNAQRRAEARKVLDELQLGIGDYLNEYARVGDTAATEFVLNPVLYLNLRPVQAGKPALQEARGSRFGHWDIGLAAMRKANNQIDATHFLDPWGNPYCWEIGESLSGGTGPRYVNYLKIWSTAGTIGQLNDDIISFIGSGGYTIDQGSGPVAFMATPGRWESLRSPAIIKVSPAPDNTPLNGAVALFDH